MINVTIWNEGRHEKESESIKAVYPDGIHNCIKSFLSVNDDLTISTAVLDAPDNGLPDDVLE